ncbi:unnamed protein product [Brassica napus]|uniref:(rape) hypothetical protein n=1 Tax=Brassica napus TaxID=3708 RepID=A0A816K1I3_BRANA|nr:unnamed protein product [Brassica napus]
MSGTVEMSGELLHSTFIQATVYKHLIKTVCLHRRRCYKSYVGELFKSTSRFSFQHCCGGMIMLSL